MRSSDPMREDEASQAAWEACKGAAYGASTWGFGVALVGAAGYMWSPVYRGTTIQFKAFLQMSGMVLGSLIEGEARLREFEQRARMQRRVLRERAKWQRYEEEFIKSNDK